MNVISLFDGMGCGAIALKELGVNVNKYYASEIDKHAIKASSQNFDNIIHLGDVTKWKEWDIEWSEIDLLLGGSPCQGFSFAGKQLAFEDPRSKLFFVFVEVWNHIKSVNPKANFLLENVKMKREHELVISRYMGVAPIEINSALLSAQNRVRLYSTNIANEPFGLFGDMQCMIPQPKDKGILLRDVLEKDVAEKFYLSEKMLKWLTRHSEKRGAKFKKLDGNQKASCLTTTEAKQNLSNDYVCVASRGREVCLTPKRTEYGKQVRKDYESGKLTEQRKNLQQLEPRTDGKTNCLTSVQKDNLVMQIPEATKKGYTEVKPGDCFDMTMPNSETRRGRLMEDKSNCLTTSKIEFMQYTNDCRIRRLTPTECARLQTIPDWCSFKGISDTQVYRMLGNGWTVEVIKHILSFIIFDRYDRRH